MKKNKEREIILKFVEESIIKIKVDDCVKI